MKITTIEMENVKRIKAVRFEPSEKGLTSIGGKNGQGKTSVLDGIAFALGGGKRKPSLLKREGSIGDPYIHIELDNGLIIERKGKNSELRVTDKTGKKSGQKILDSLIPELAIDLPKFLNSNDSDKAKILLRILGVEDQLAELDRMEQAKYDTRTLTGRMRDQKKAAADDMEEFSDVPEEEMSVSKLIREQQAILLQNEKNREAREQYRDNVKKLDGYIFNLEELAKEIKEVKENINEYTKLVETGKKSVEQLKDESTDEIETKIANFESINRKIQANKKKAQAIAEAEELSEQYNSLTEDINNIRNKRLALLDSADLPYEGLGIEKGCLTCDGKRWDCMSSSEQMIVGTAIVSRLNPECKFVLLDKLEQLDVETLKEFDKWLSKHDLQAIATRVSTGDECSLIIEDGETVKQDIPLKERKEEDDDNWDEEDY